MSRVKVLLRKIEFNNSENLKLLISLCFLTLMAISFEQKAMGS